VVGKPVFSDETGAYAVAVPESLKGSLRLVAKVPVSQQDDPLAKDPRVAYNLVVKADAKDPVIDEDTAQVTKYLRSCFAARIREALISEDIAGTSATMLIALQLSPMLSNFLEGTLREINEAGKAAKVREMPPERQELLTQRVTDVLLSYVELDDLVYDPAVNLAGGEKGPAIPFLVETMRKIRATATAKMRTNPNFFNELPRVKQARQKTEIRKPADVSQFVVDEYVLDTTANRAPDLNLFFIDIGLTIEDGARVNALSINILTAVGQTLLTNAEAKAGLLAAIKASAQ
jgi:hypothetical protein